MGRMDGKVVLISGGAHPEGQGASHGALLAREGARVVLADVRDELGAETAGAIAAQGLDVAYTHLDVTRPADWDAAVAFVEARHGRLDVVVNNAGIDSRPGILECTDEEWERVIAIDQTGVFLGMRHGAPALQRAGGGSIVNIASVYGLGGGRGFVSYIAAKAAVIGMTRSAAFSLGQHRIRVNAIAPGLIRTAMLTEDGTRALSTLDGFVARQALQWVAEPIDVSYGVLYLASDESRFVTGTVLPIDGGFDAG